MTNFEKINDLKLQAIENPKTSEKYQIIDTTQIVDKVGDVLGKNDVSYQLSVLHSPGPKTTRHSIKFRFNQPLHILGDEIYPEIIIMNSFQGETALNVYVGIYRMVCSNGMVVGKNIYQSRVIHRKGQTLEQKVGVLEEEIEAAVAFIREEFVSKIEQQVSKELTVEEMFSLLRELKFSKKFTETVQDYIMNRKREEDEDNNVWSFYNIVNEVQRERSRSEFADLRKNIELLDKIQESVEKLAA